MFLNIPRVVVRLAVLALLAWTSPVAWADTEYRLMPGDVLGLTVLGIPELTGRAAIDADGNAALPLIGQVAVAGLSIRDARGRIQSLFATQPFRQRADDGREYALTISPSEVNLTVAEYRPVYVNGDVAKPGEQVYRPGLTVRKAVALCGGYDVLHYRLENPYVQASDLKGQKATLWIEFARRKAEVLRLQAELDDAPRFDGDPIKQMPLPKGLSEQIVENEQRQLAVRQLDFAREEAYLASASAKEGERGDLLSAQQGKEKEGVKADTADLQRYEELYSKGTTTLPLRSDARRALLLSSTRELQTSALLASVEREEGDLKRKLEHSKDDRRAVILKALIESNTALAETGARLEAAGEKLLYVGSMKAAMIQGSDIQPKIKIVRGADAHQAQIPADLDTTLQPGDVVEVSLGLGEALVR